MSATRAPEPDASWMAGAACRGLDPELFFTARGANDDHAAAKAICRGCPVVTACLGYALASNEKYGIWGGMDEPERRRTRRRGLVA